MRTRKIRMQYVQDVVLKIFESRGDRRTSHREPASFFTPLRGASGRPLQPPCTVAAVTLWLDLSKLNAACLCIWFIYINPELLVVL